MKSNIVVLCLGLLLLIPTCVLAQYSTSLHVFGGLGQSNFDLKNHSQASSIEAGASLLYGKPFFQVGIEYSTNELFPFTYVFENNNDDFEIYREKMIHRQFGTVLKFNLIRYNDLEFFIRGGGSYYFGDYKIEYSDEYKDINPNADNVQEKFKNQFGYNLGLGFHRNFIFFSFIYHIVDHQIDVEGAEKYTGNHWVMRTGIKLF